MKPQQGITSRTWIEPEIHTATELPQFSPTQISSGRGVSYQEHSLYNSDNGNNSILQSALEVTPDYTEKPQSYSDDFRAGKRAKRSCCCIPSNPRSRNRCIALTAFTVVFLCIIAFLFAPRFPRMKVLSINLSDSTRSFRLLGLTPGNTKNFTVQLDMYMNVSVLNPNYYRLKIENLDLKTYISANVSDINTVPYASQWVAGEDPQRVFKTSDQEVLIGTGTKKAALDFQPGMNQTFLMNLTVIYRPDPKYELHNDVVFNEFYKSCGGNNGGHRPMTIRYRAEAPVKLLAWIGFVPTFEDSIRINCPFSQEQIAGLVSNLKDKPGDFDGASVAQSPQVRVQAAPIAQQQQSSVNGPLAAPVASLPSRAPVAIAAQQSNRVTQRQPAPPENALRLLAPNREALRQLPAPRGDTPHQMLAPRGDTPHQVAAPRAARQVAQVSAPEQQQAGK